MQPRVVEEIHAWLRTDPRFKELCKKDLRSDNWDEIVAYLRKGNIAAEREDLAYALAYQWVLGNGSSEEAGVRPQRAPDQASEKVVSPPSPDKQTGLSHLFSSAVWLALVFLGTLLVFGAASVGMLLKFDGAVVTATAGGSVVLLCGLLLAVTRSQPREHTFKRLDAELQDGLIGVVRQIDYGYAVTMWMYTITFYVGVALVILSALRTVGHSADRSALLFGGVGLTDIIAQLIFKPAHDVQASRANLAQLQAAFFNWINDVYNWDRYLELLQDQAGKSGSIPELNEVSKVSTLMLANTRAMLEMVAQHCDHFSRRGDTNTTSETKNHGSSQSERKRRAKLSKPGTVTAPTILGPPAG
jgi:hypothetical protein